MRELKRQRAQEKQEALENIVFGVISGFGVNDF
jgi:hypothetical protein